MMALANWEIPAHYGDPESEYKAARAGVALMDVSFLTKVTARGKDHLEYLNRRTSQRVIEQQPGEGQRANQLNGEGRMEADFVFYRVDEELSLLISPPTISGQYLQALMDKYVFTEDAVFEEACEQWAAFALLGPKAQEVLTALGAGRPANRAISSISLEGKSVYLLENDFTCQAPVVLVKKEDAAPVFAKLRSQVEGAGGRLIGFLPFDTLRVEAGIAWWGIDLTEQSIPLDADLTDAIHTNKGCYPGQETIAKVINLGHPARKLVGIEWDSEDPPPAGSEITSDGKKAGVLTSSTYSPRQDKAIGLAMVRWKYREAGTQVTGERGTSGTIVTLPFG